jgi:hypothetical protein
MNSFSEFDISLLPLLRSFRGMNEKLVQHIKIVLLYIGQIKIQKKHMLVDEKEGM